MPHLESQLLYNIHVYTPAELTQIARAYSNLAKKSRCHVPMRFQDLKYDQLLKAFCLIYEIPFDKQWVLHRPCRKFWIWLDLNACGLFRPSLESFSLTYLSGINKTSWDFCDQNLWNARIQPPTVMSVGNWSFCHYRRLPKEVLSFLLSGKQEIRQQALCRNLALARMVWLLVWYGHRTVTIDHDYGSDESSCGAWWCSWWFCCWSWWWWWWW